MIMAMVSSTPPSNLSQTLPFGITRNAIRGSPSFPSCFDAKDETFLRKLADDRNRLEGKRNLDPEIGVFGAEKYFNDEIGVELPRSPLAVAARNYQFDKYEEDDSDHHCTRQKNRTSTPSVRSESSWTSQTVLLQNFLKNSPRPTKSNKINGKNFLTAFGCNFYCSDKTSVDVSEDPEETSFHKASIFQPKTPLSNPPVDERPSWMKASCAANPPLKAQLQGEEFEERKSLEVFGSPAMGKRNKSKERHLSLFSFDSNSQAKDIGFSANLTAIYDDSESNESSDLFEIESLTGRTTNPFLGRQSSDETASGCLTPTTCYAPSEASIEWSVITGTAADFSIMSDFDDKKLKMSPARIVPASRTTKTNKNKLIQRRSSTLLSCKSSKAVRVAGDAHRTADKVNTDHVRICHRPDFFMPVKSFEAEAKIAYHSLPSQSPRILGSNH